MKIRIEWKPQDLWIGVFWERHVYQFCSIIDVWICFVPCIPLHISRWYQNDLQEKATANACKEYQLHTAAENLSMGDLVKIEEGIKRSE